MRIALLVFLEQETTIAPPKLIINRIRQHLMTNGDALDINEITTHLSIDLLGIISDDESVITSSNKGEPVVMDPNNTASLGYRNIARRILGESVPLMSMNVPKKSFMSKFRSLFSSK